MRFSCVFYAFFMRFLCVCHAFFYAFFMRFLCVFHAFHMRFSCVFHAFVMRFDENNEEMTGKHWEFRSEILSKQSLNKLYDSEEGEQ